MILSPIKKTKYRQFFIFRPLPPQKGFTLVELMIYITIISAFMVALTNFTVDIIGIKTKSQGEQEVQQNVRLAITRISREIRAAQDVNAGDSIFGSSPGKISLAMEEDSGNNPTIIDVNSDRLRIKQGSGDYQYLTNDKVRITNLVFTDLSGGVTPKVVKVSLAAEYAVGLAGQGPAASASVETTVSLRQKP